MVDTVYRICVIEGVLNSCSCELAFISSHLCYLSICIQELYAVYIPFERIKMRTGTTTTKKIKTTTEGLCGCSAATKNCQNGSYRHMRCPSPGVETGCVQATKKRKKKRRDELLSDDDLLFFLVAGKCLPLLMSLNTVH